MQKNKNMTKLVSIKKELVSWAISESQCPVDFLLGKKKYLSKLINSGEATFTQLKDFASTCHVPFGFLFLSNAPSESSLSPSFRTIKNIHPGIISQNLKQTINDMEFKRDWMSSFREEAGFSAINIANTIKKDDSISDCAKAFRGSFSIPNEWYDSIPNEKAAFAFLREKAEKFGFIVMESGIVGNNSKRKLDINEFRGFFLSDPFAPLVFINSCDSTTAKIFTLIHECCHAFMNGSEDLLTAAEDTDNERFINSIVAEILMPTDLVIKFSKNKNLNDINDIRLISHHFKTSLTSSTYRLFNLNLISKELFDSVTQIVANSISKKRPGGDYYATLYNRISNSFLHAVISSVNNASTTYTEGFNLLGVSSYSSFEKLSAYSNVKDYV